MACASPYGFGAAMAFPGRQVIALCGDGGLAMLLGDLLTAIQEEIAVKIVVFNNGTLGFVELEMKVEGLVNAYTDLKNPDFARLAEVIGFKGWRVETGDALEDAVLQFLAHPGPALLDVKVNRTELVMPPKIEPAMAFGALLYSAKAVLGGHAADVADLIESNIRR